MYVVSSITRLAAYDVSKWHNLIHKIVHFLFQTHSTSIKHSILRQSIASYAQGAVEWLTQKQAELVYVRIHYRAKTQNTCSQAGNF